MNEEILNKINRLEERVESLNNSVATKSEISEIQGRINQDNFSSETAFRKYNRFIDFLKIPKYTTNPTTCQVGEIIEVSGVLKICSASNTWTNVSDDFSYSQLADGTDGNLITWDASGVPALVATGNAGQFLTSNGAGTAPTFQSFSSFILATASDTLVASADNVQEENSDTYTKKKETIIRVGGTIRVKFDLNGNNNQTSSYAKIYINDTAIGAERQSTGLGYTTFSEDISIAPFDKIQIYAKDTSGSGGDLAQVRNFRIYFDVSASTTYYQVINN